MTQRFFPLLITFLILSGVSFVFGQDNQSGWPPGASPYFCHGDDCPVFITSYSNASSQIEIRNYSPGLWISTNVSGTNFTKETNFAFYSVFGYISGENSEGQVINMTAPVSIEIFPGSGPFCNTTFVLSFFVPFQYQLPSNPPPKPTNKDVYVNFQNARRLAVIQFGGFVNSFDVIIPQYQILSEWLGQQNASYTPNLYTVCQYDSPFTITGRHNELWIEIE